MAWHHTFSLWTASGHQFVGWNVAWWRALAHFALWERHLIRAATWRQHVVCEVWSVKARVLTHQDQTHRGENRFGAGRVAQSRRESIGTMYCWTAQLGIVTSHRFQLQQVTNSDEVPEQKSLHEVAQIDRLPANRLGVYQAAECIWTRKIHNSRTDSPFKQDVGTKIFIDSFQEIYGQVWKFVIESWEVESAKSLRPHTPAGVALCAPNRISTAHSFGE